MTRIEELAVRLFAQLHDDHRTQSELEVIEAALKAVERETWEAADHFFDALEDEENPLTAAALIVHFQEYCRRGSLTNGPGVGGTPRGTSGGPLEPPKEQP